MDLGLLCVFSCSTSTIILGAERCGFLAGWVGAITVPVIYGLGLSFERKRIF